MAPVTYSVVDDKELDDAALWAVIDSAVAAASSSSSRSHKPLAITYPNFQSPITKPSAPPKFPKNPRTPYSNCPDSRISPKSEVMHDHWDFQPPRKTARTCSSEASESSPLMVVRNGQKTPTTPVYRSPESYLSPQIVSGSEDSPKTCWRNDEKEVKHSLCGRFPSVALFKEYQNTAISILERSDYTMISGHPFIKKSGWRKISFYFNLSFEIKDKTIEFDEDRNVIRAEFVVRAHMQNGRFSDGWGSCDRREKRFTKPNHDIPSTAETRAKNRASQDLLGIGEYQPGAGQGKQ